jgi:hypothetical protein
MANTTAQTNPSSLFDDEDFSLAPPKQAPVEAVAKKKPTKSKGVSVVDDRPYVVHRGEWTQMDTIALRERLQAEREERAARGEW